MAIVVLVALEQRYAPHEQIVTGDLAASLLPSAARVLVHIGPRAAIVMAALAERRYPGLWGGFYAASVSSARPADGACSKSLSPERSRAAISRDRPRARRHADREGGLRRAHLGHRRNRRGGMAPPLPAAGLTSP